MVAGVQASSECLTFKLGKEEYGIEILNVAGRVVGMVVDSVSDVIRLTPEQIRTVPDFSSSTFDTKYITGLGTIDARMLILVDIEKLMSGADMALMEEATQQ
jgi:purine-binding chemotaxis protein CheW